MISTAIWSMSTATLLFGSGAPVGLLLDPPYAQERRQARLYATEDDCAVAVRAWAVAHGENPKLRIAFCGLAGEHVMPDSWSAYRWQARGGLQNTKHNGRGSGETRQEVVWFSPHCPQAVQLDFQLREAPRNPSPPLPAPR
jgi:DNA adenine methylase